MQPLLNLIWLFKIQKVNKQTNKYMDWTFVLKIFHPCTAPLIKINLLPANGTLSPCLLQCSEVPSGPSWHHQPSPASAPLPLLAVPSCRPRAERTLEWAVNPRNDSSCKCPTSLVTFTRTQKHHTKVSASRPSTDHFFFWPSPCPREASSLTNSHIGKNPC